MASIRFSSLLREVGAAACLAIPATLAAAELAPGPPPLLEPLPPVVRTSVLTPVSYAAPYSSANTVMPSNALPLPLPEPQTSYGPAQTTYTAPTRTYAAPPADGTLEAHPVWTPYGDGTATGSTPPAINPDGSPVDGKPPAPTGFDDPELEEPWAVTFMPKSLIYHSYKAGAWEPRFASVWSKDRTDGYRWDITLGGRVGIFRYGTPDSPQPNGWQIDMEGAAMPRLDPMNQVDLWACDYRFGVPVTYGNGPYQMKLAVAHISSHLGDEYILRSPGHGGERINFGRNSLVWGHSYYMNPATRVYGEVDWASDSQYSEPWYLQFGSDWFPILREGPHFAPFVAVNTQLRQELNFGGNFVIQAGYCMRQGADRRMFRVGLQYYNGGNQQFEFYTRAEQKIGFGLWYDY